jgi:hypothetical protein
MLKRKIGVVVVGMLLGAQVGLAAADESAVPLGAQDIRAKGEPSARTTFRTGHSTSNAASRSAAMPSNDDDIVSNGEPPVRSTYQQRHPDGGSAE